VRRNAEKERERIKRKWEKKKERKGGEKVLEKFWVLGYWDLNCAHFCAGAVIQITVRGNGLFIRY
jgi:hypothetical protein